MTVLGAPRKAIRAYDDFVAKNSGQVAQIESALRSLTYIIPGRFRDAEIASETLHSSIQLLSLYHDSLLTRASTPTAPAPTPRGPSPTRGPPSPSPSSSSSAKPPSSAASTSPHTRYTRYWTNRSTPYRRIALLLQMVRYTQLLVEMAAKRRGGDELRWRVVVVLEFIKAVCRLLLLKITRVRAVVSPVLPEREAIAPSSEDDGSALRELMGEDEQEGENGDTGVPEHEKEWRMPRTGMTLPKLPTAGDMAHYLLSRVLTPEDIKPATKLLNQLRGQSHAAEVLHILSPLVYAVCLALTPAEKRRRAWGPWVAGLAVEYAARQLRERGLRTTPLERDEWRRRGWGMGWWAMRGPFYEGVVRGVVEGVRGRVPSIVGGILEDYEYLWENYYFSTSD